MNAKNSPKKNAEAPRPAQELSRLAAAAGAPAPMSPWQAQGFAYGLACGLGELPAEAFSAAEDPDGELFLDCLDELSRKNEDEDCPVPAEDLAEGPSGPELRRRLAELVGAADRDLARPAGQPDFAFAAAAAEAQDPALADMPSARAFARGLLRGFVMGQDDEEGLADEAYGEALSLIFILTEEDLGPDFGSPAEIAETRQAVAMALPGLTAQLWRISRGEAADEEADEED